MAKEELGDFKVGDVVQLKSGGPKMTVAEKQPHMASNRGIYCQWFAGSKLESGFFSAEVLTQQKDEKKGG